MTAAPHTTGTRAAAAPGANWAGWAGYTPTARGPAERLARARAAGLVDGRRGAERDAAPVRASSPTAEGTLNMGVLEDAVRPRRAPCPKESRMRRTFRTSAKFGASGRRGGRTEAPVSRV